MGGRLRIRRLLINALYLLLIAPVAVLLVYILLHPEEYWSALAVNGNLYLIFKTLLLSSAVAFIATFWGLVAAMGIYKWKIRFSYLYLFLLLLPLLSPTYIFATAWRDAWEIQASWENYGSLILYVLVSGIIYTPLAVLITGSALASVSRSYEESAAMYVPPYKVFIHMVYPMIKSSLGLSFILIMIMSIGDFSLPAIWGVKTFTTDIFTRFTAFYDSKTALGQSVVLLLITGGLLFARVQALNRLPGHLTGTGGHTSSQHKPVFAYAVHIFLWLLIAAGSIIPLFYLVKTAFSAGFSVWIRAWSMMKTGIADSLLISLFAALSILLMGIIAIRQKNEYTNSFPYKVLLWGFVIPSSVAGMSLINFYNRPGLYPLYASVFILLAGYGLRFGFLATGILERGFLQIPASLTEVAMMMGIQRKSILFKIVLPLMLPWMTAAFLLSFILSFNELGTSIMTYPPGVELLPVTYFTIEANASQALTAAMGSINFTISLLFILLFYFLLSRVKTHR